MARFRVSAQIIMDSLAMPEGSKLRAIVQDEFHPNVFVFYVEHPDLPEEVEGMPPVEIMPIVKADYERRPSMWLTFEWNVDRQNTVTG
jgi:hypothetical protein